MQSGSLQNEKTREHVGISEAENLESEETFEILCPRPPKSAGSPSERLLSRPRLVLNTSTDRALISTRNSYSRKSFTWRQNMPPVTSTNSITFCLQNSIILISYRSFLFMYFLHFSLGLKYLQCRFS